MFLILVLITERALLDASFARLAIFSNSERARSTACRRPGGALWAIILFGGCATFVALCFVLIAEITLFDTSLARLAIHIYPVNRCITVGIVGGVVLVAIVFASFLTSRWCRTAASTLVGVLVTVLVTELLLRDAAQARAAVLAFSVDFLALASMAVVLVVFPRTIGR